MEIKPKVLIVDDKIENLIALEKTLEDMKIEFIRALSGNEALAMTLEHEFALAIVDVQMPDMDGYETVQLMRQEKKTKLLPVIFLSAIYSQNYHQIKGIEAGAVDFISKPFPPKVLRGKVMVFMDLYNQHKDLEREIELRKKIATELNQTNILLADSNKALEEFAYIVSHDLKEPLRGISNYSKFLLEDYGHKLDDQGQDKLHVIVRLTDKMHQLIESVLYYSKVGRTELGVKETNLQTVLDEVIESLKFLIKEKNVRIQIPKELPIIKCDSTRIGEVLHNLISNAIKYNDKDLKWIEIGYKQNCIENHDRSIPIFFVKDNGAGIQERNLTKVFQMFKRIHRNTNDDEGTGIGLTIAKKIIEKHNGRIWVESEYGKGSTFYFTLAEHHGDNT